MGAQIGMYYKQADGSQYFAIFCISSETRHGPHSKYVAHSRTKIRQLPDFYN